ncbi:hypothetical protein SFC66_05210 [Terribacillus saccharophilus]|uniref:WapI family immunity protein n=1 Tax=Terribacillus saccharophilus TaxID=361277 RepID=UPI003981A40F
MVSQEVRYFDKYPYSELKSQDERSCFKICSYQYAYPDAENEYDADWHKNYLYVTLPSFQAEIDDIMLEGRYLECYLDELNQFLSLKKRKVMFEPTEPFFSLGFSFNRIKKVEVSGFVQYPVGNGSQLEFEFETDLAYIERFAEGLQKILQQFPVKDQ